MTKTINQDNLNASIRMLDKMGEANLEQLKLVDEAQAERMEKLGELTAVETTITYAADVSEGLSNGDTITGGGL